MSNFNMSNPATVGILAFFMAGRLIQALEAKGLLSSPEVADLYRKALQGVGPENREEAKNLLKFMFPDLRSDIP